MARLTEVQSISNEAFSPHALFIDIPSVTRS